MIEDNTHHRHSIGMIPRNLSLRFLLAGYRCLLVALIFFLSPPVIKPLFADGIDDWPAAKARLEQIANSESRCEDTWDLLWPWAKQGNLEARHMLFFLMVPPPDMDVILPPGNNGDRISRQKDYIIMLTHSLDYKGEFLLESFRKDSIDLYRYAGFGRDARSEEFLACAEQGNENCAEIAVKKNLVPSFEEYAAQIDLFLEKGMKAQCMNSRKN